MPEQITKESEAWREVARRIAEGDEIFATYGGMCFVVDNMREQKCITTELYNQMDAAIEGHILVSDPLLIGRGWAFPSGDADVRVFAALFLALKAEDEGR